MEDVLRRYTLFDDIILLLMMHTWFMCWCCPCHYSTGNIPVPFVDREEHQGAQLWGS